MTKTVLFFLGHSPLPVRLLSRHIRVYGVVRQILSTNVHQRLNRSRFCLQTNEPRPRPFGKPRASNHADNEASLPDTSTRAKSDEYITQEQFYPVCQLQYSCAPLMAHKVFHRLHGTPHTAQAPQNPQGEENTNGALHPEMHRFYEEQQCTPPHWEASIET